MSKDVKDGVDICDDFSPFFEEESMPESFLHAELVWYLMAVLKWLFQGEPCAICENFAFFPPPEWPGPPVAPDLAVLKGVAEHPLISWHVDQTRPAPQVVLEILSRETWKKDLEEKPLIYARLGVHEYFAYDPNSTPLAEATRHRLFGWRRDRLWPHMTALLSNADGSLWSEELASFLLPDGELLRLADADHHLRLTGEEAQAQARWAAEQQMRQLLEKLRLQGIDPERL